MATFNVSDVNGLVAAINSANANSEADTIELAAGMYDASAYTATNRTTDPDFIESGVLATNAFPVIRSEITIQGAGAAVAIITREGTEPLRLLLVADGGALSLYDVTLRKGDVGEADTGGGAVYNRGFFQTARCVFKANKSGYGGAIRNDDSAQIHDCQISENWGGWGGGLYNDGDMFMWSSLISDNESPDGGGLINYDHLHLDDSIVAGNRAIYGGGIGNYGGRAYLHGNTVSGNNASEGGSGLYNRAGDFYVSSSSIVKNTGFNGKGVLNDDSEITVHADYNWWGKASGPDTDDVAGLVSTADYQTTEPENQAYWYDRYGASRVAAQTSIKNFDKFATSLNGDARNSSNNPCDPDREQCVFDNQLYSSVGGGFWYHAGNVLAHRSYPKPPPESEISVPANSTGSAIFISEMVHRGGGIPMLRGDGVTDCADDEGGDLIETGWYVCADEVFGNCLVQNTTSTWKGHERLKAYFLDQLGALVQASLSFPFVTQINDVDVLNFTGNAGTLNSPFDLADFQDHIYSIFNSNPPRVDVDPALQTIRTGDYVYLGTAVSHGFLIVGWGPAVECPAGLNSPLVASVDANSAEGQYQLARIPNTVPYVVDFAYSFKADPEESPNPDTNDPDENMTGWLQDP